MDRAHLLDAYQELQRGVGERIRGLYRTVDSRGRPCDVLYHFWVMQANCTACQLAVDLFPSWIVGRHANPRLHPTVRILCPGCGDIFSHRGDSEAADCPSCHHQFNPREGRARGKSAVCNHCNQEFTILDAIRSTGQPPAYRLIGKLALSASGKKEYLKTTAPDHHAYAQCSELLAEEVHHGKIQLPDLTLSRGYNTRQAMNYGFHAWRDFFNDRQLLALGWLRASIADLPHESSREVLLTLCSALTEFHNRFTSYKGEGTGAIRHMFSHHILKPERMPIEGNVWGTPKSSGAFSTLFDSRVLRAVDYRLSPTEVNTGGGPSVVCAEPFSGRVAEEWPTDGHYLAREIYLSCGSSCETGLASGTIDFVVTDPPFFDNVHYSELADFFYAWQQLSESDNTATTRAAREVQDTDSHRFSEKLRAVFTECHRVIKADGLLVFTYHHSRDDGWTSLANAVLGAGFVIVNCHPVKGEMSVATPKSQAKDPIQLDMILVCRKATEAGSAPSLSDALASARAKLIRLCNAKLRLSRNDCRIALVGQALTSIRSTGDIAAILPRVDFELETIELTPVSPATDPSHREQLSLFQV